MKTKRKTKSVGQEKGFKWAYKVVKLRGLGAVNIATGQTIYTSAWIYGKYAVEYEIGKETVAPVGGLLVFKTFERADEWGRQMFLNYQVLKVRAYEPVELFKAANTNCFYGRKTAMQQFWNPKTRSQLVKSEGYDWPLGTLAFRRIIPTKEMK